MTFTIGQKVKVAQIQSDHEAVVVDVQITYLVEFTKLPQGHTVPEGERALFGPFSEDHFVPLPEN